MNRLLIGSGLLLSGIAAINSSIFTVDAGHRALIFDNISGLGDKVYAEGFHFKVPMIQDVIDFDVRMTPRLMKAETGSKDLQKVNAHVRVLYRPDLSMIKHIYTNLGLNYADQILPGITTEIAKSVIAQYNAEELVTQRDNVSKIIRSILVERAGQYGIILEDVSLTQISFSKEFTSAIEQKQVAQQSAEKQKFLVEKSRQEKEAEVILAEGETEAAKLIQDAMKNGNEFVELRRIEASKEIAETLAKSNSVTYIPSGANTLFPLGGRI
eukprot:TRINITY_DN4241_c0_g1_i1.p1 TRINITY_DN4241_c0_g1~~TRINITY_DN4241_c0_g1_i1.p1  ORF type:complete len:276 (-),score=134.79 TRINITY_DN4241_c0_g1_i1:111-917(-)